MNSRHMSCKYHFNMLSYKISLLLLLISFFEPSHQLIKITNIKCLEPDKSFGYFKYCRLKAVKRDVTEVSYHFKILKTPVTNCLVRVNVLRKTSRYMPFLFTNVTLDACAFMRNHKKYKLFDFFYQFFAKYTNINHTCPYDHDLIMDRYSITHDQMNIPWPNGEFQVQSIWSVDNKEVVAFYTNIVLSQFNND